MRSALMVGATIAIAVGGLVVWWMTRSDGDPMGGLAADLPRNVHAWTAEEQDALYDSESIYDYIDGHAEVYLAYGMDRCFARRYEDPAGQSAVVLDVFRLSSPDNAFGVFTHDQDGDPVEIGADGLLRPGWLSFWQDRYFVSIYAEVETPEAVEVLLELGRLTAAALPPGGELPDLVTSLPSSGLEERSVRYLHHELILASHLFLADYNLLDIDPEVDVALARYTRGPASAHLLVARYPTTERADRAGRRVVEDLLPESPQGAVLQLEDGSWARIGVAGRNLVLVLDATDAGLADALVEETIEGVAP